MDLYEEVKSKNVVSFFGNDLYRRFISLCVINRFSYQIRSPIGTNSTHNDGHNITKRSVILVSDLDQIPAEGKTIRNHTNLMVGEFISDDIPSEVDSWNQLIAHKHVLIMSCSLFSTLLSRSLITIANINLIILNDCHLVLSNDSYKQLSTFLKSTNPNVTRLLAFSPSLMKCHRKPSEIEAIICKMEKLLQASRNTITDLQMSFRFPVKPKGRIIYYNEYELPFELINSDKIQELLNDLKTLIKDCHHVFNSTNGINGTSLLLIIRKVFTIAKTMGTYCAMELTEIYAKELAELISNYRDPHLSAILSSTLSFFQYVQVTLRQQLSLSLIYEQLQGGVLEKMLAILKVLLDYVPALQSPESTIKNPSGLHGIIFVEDRTTVRLLSAWLRSVSENFEQFNFIKVDYLVPSVNIPGSKFDFPTTSRFENMMYKYRKQDINLLVVSTSYEKDLELAKCNLVIRYDFPLNFDQYLNSKQKLRTDNGKYVLFIPRNDSMKKDHEQKLREFVSMENIMKSRELEVERPPPYETLSDQFPPFVTCKEASVDLTNSILILHRYCTRLPSDTFTRLVPIYSYQTLDNGLIQCTIHLPTNSPVRDAIKGSPANHQDVAQRSAALEACRALHQVGEINDLLWPVGKENNKCLEELGIKRPKRVTREALQDRPGTTKRRQSYHKSVAESLKGGDIVPGEPCYMYVFLMSLTCPIPEEQNTRGRKLVDPMDSPRFFGLITRSRISRICDFPVYTRSGEVLISMKWATDKLIFDADQVTKLKHFHRFTFNDVLRLVKDPMVFEPSDAPSSFLILPVNYSPTVSRDVPSTFGIDSNTISIDWQFIDKVLDYEKTDHMKERKTNFKFDKNVFADAVVKPWYRSANEQLPFYVANICDYLKPTSQFPTQSYPTFYDYYLQKYGIKITDKEQSLLDVDHTSARLNFLTPRFVNRKGMPLPKSTEKTRTAKRENLQSKQLLVPELCIVHPFSASFWNKAVCLPSILYRVNHLLIADQLNRQIARDIGIGVTKDDFAWPTLDFGWSLTDVLNQAALEDKDSDDYDSTMGSVQAESSKSKKKKPSKQTSNSSTSNSCTVSSTVPAPTKKVNIPEPPPVIVVPEPSPEPAAEADDDGLLIDTFDPSIYKVENFDYDDDLGEIGSIGNWDASGSGGGIFEIDPKNFGRVMDLGDDEPRIVEVDDGGNPIKRSNGLRVGSPSSFDSKCDTTSNWMANTSGSNGVIDLDIPGLNIIATGNGDFDLHKLSKDLENIHAYDDFEDSEDEDEGDIVNCDFEEDFEDAFDEDQLLIPDHDESVTIMKEEKCKDILSSGLLLSSQIDDLITTGDKMNGISTYDNLKVPESWIDENIISYSELGREKVEKIFSFDEITLDDTEDLVVGNETTENIIKELDNDIDDLRSIQIMPNDISVIESIESDAHNLSVQSTFTDEMSFSEVIPSFGELLPNRDEINFPEDSVTKPIHLDPLNEEFDPEVGPSPAMVLQALTMSNASDGINLERLETVGDSFLKYAVTVFMYCQCHQHEGILSQLRSTQISNLKLYELGSEKNLGELMVATKFEPSDNWLPPGFKIPVKKRYETFNNSSGDFEEKSFNCLLTQQSIPDKSIADCVEALIGAYLISCGPRGALLFMRWLGVMVMDDVKESQPPTGLWRWLNPIAPPLFPNASSDDLMTLYRSYGLDRFEKQIIQYEFKDKAYLVQAFTHNSFSDNRVTDCYQRLEFLGDAVLDFLITRHLFDDPSQHSPGVLTDLRSALANNTFFASLAVEYEFHKYLMYKTSDLHKVISKFVEHHGSNGKLRDPVVFSLLLTEADCEQPEDIEVPKALGDVFESVAGAIFLDSGLSLDTVWRVYYNMMKPEMEYFSKNPPKSPIRELLEMKPQKVSFSKPENININGGVKTRISVEVFNVGKYIGIGRNRRLAKYTAAKRALRDLKAPNKNSNND